MWPVCVHARTTQGPPRRGHSRAPRESQDHGKKGQGYPVECQGGQLEQWPRVRTQTTWLGPVLSVGEPWVRSSARRERDCCAELGFLWAAPFLFSGHPGKLALQAPSPGDSQEPGSRDSTSCSGSSCGARFKLRSLWPESLGSLPLVPLRHLRNYVLKPVTW